MHVCKAPAKRCGLQVKHTGQFLRCKGGVCADVAPELRRCSGIGLKGGELIRANIRVYERLIRKRAAAGKQFAARGDGTHAVEHVGSRAFAGTRRRVCDGHARACAARAKSGFHLMKACGRCIQGRRHHQDIPFPHVRLRLKQLVAECHCKARHGGKRLALPETALGFRQKAIRVFA